MARAVPDVFIHNTPEHVQRNLKYVKGTTSYTFTLH
jgi:hypothetical protein